MSRYTPQNFWCRTPPPAVPRGVAPRFGSEKVSRYTGVSQLQLRVSRYTVQLRSEAWGPNFKKKSSWSEKAILGALGEFRGILGGALGVRKIILGTRNPILGVAYHDLSDAKTTILGATLGAIPGIAANPHERLSFAPCILGAFFQELGWSPHAREMKTKEQKFKMSRKGSPSCVSKIQTQDA